MGSIISGNFPEESEKTGFYLDNFALSLEFPMGLWKMKVAAAKPGVSATGLELCT